MCPLPPPHTKKRRAARRCCDTVPVFVSAGLCVCAVSFGLLLRTRGSSLQRSRGLMGTCTNSSMQPPPPFHPQVVSCSYMAATANWDAGQTWQTRLCCSGERRVSLCSLRIDQSGISDTDTDYSGFNFPINDTLPIVLAVLELRTSTDQFRPWHTPTLGPGTSHCVIKMAQFSPFSS